MTSMIPLATLIEQINTADSEDLIVAFRMLREVLFLLKILDQIIEVPDGLELEVSRLSLDIERFLADSDEEA